MSGLAPVYIVALLHDLCRMKTDAVRIRLMGNGLVAVVHKAFGEAFKAAAADLHARLDSLEATLNEVARRATTT